MITLLFALALGGMPNAPSFRPAARDFERPGNELCFPSGLRVTLIHDDRQPVVSVTTVIDRGAGQDPEGREGSAHLMEHLWFRATTPNGTVEQRLDDLGADANAYTLGDATVYMAQADAAVLDELIALEALRLSDPLSGIDSQVLEEERAIVDAEGRLRGLVNDDFPRFLPPGFGKRENRLRPRSATALSAITMDDLREVGGAYVPATTTIQVAGPIDPRAVQAMFEASFSEDQLFAGEGACGGRAPEVTVAPPPAAPQGDLYTVTMTVEEPVVLMGWVVPPAYGRYQPVMAMARSLMEDRLKAFVSRSRFRGARGACEMVPGPTSSSLICMSTIPEGANGESIIDGMKSIGEPMGGSNEAERVFERASLRARTDILIGLDSLSPLRSDHALRDVLSNHYGGSPMWFADAMTALGEVRMADQSEFMTEWTTRDQAWVSVVLPPNVHIGDVLAGDRAEEEAGSGTTAMERASRDGTPTFEHQRALPQRDPVVGLPDPSPPTVSAPVVRFLQNGMRVLIVPHGRAPVSHMALVVDGAGAAEAELGMDAWAWELTGIDAGLFPERSMSLAADLLAAQLWFDESGTSRTIGMSGSVATLDGQMYVLRAFADSVDRMGTEYRQDRHRDIRRTARALRSDAAFVQRQAQWVHALGPDTALAWSPTMLLEKGASTSLAKGDRHRRKLWRPGNATLYIVGPVDPSEAGEQAEAWFGSWTGGSTQPNPTEVRAAPVPSQRVAYEAVDAERTTAAVSVLCRLPDGTDETVAQVTAALLREWAYAELRESELAAYDPNVSFWQTGGVGTMRMSATVGPEYAAKAADAMDRGLAWLAAGVDDEDATRVARRLRASWTSSFVQSSDVLSHIITHGRELPTVARTRGDAYTSVTAAQVQATARACSAGAALGVVTPEGGAVSQSTWNEVMTQPELPR